MLIVILRELADHESNSYADLAKKLNVNKETINYLIEDLVRMGCIQLQEATCEDEDSCKGCPVGCKNNTSKMKIWEMTPKGKKILGIK
jgi:predicted transcriptional regulator